MEHMLNKEALRRLLAAGDGDACLYYIWHCYNDASLPCPLGEVRRKTAENLLYSLGLIKESPAVLARDSRPAYTEDSLEKNLQKQEFSRLVGEAQRLLGRVLSVEELKVLLSLYDYLHLPVEVASLLISYCVQRAKNRGGNRPTLRAIEKEGYAWADKGIDTVEAAVQYMQSMLQKQGRVGSLMKLLQISGRSLTPAEQQYIAGWLDWGFPDEAIALAYEKTVLNTGGLKWPYMNSILKSWNEKNLHTLEEIRAGDGVQKLPGQNKRKTAPGDAERDALRKLMQEKEG